MGSRGIVVVLAGSLGLAACRTTHTIGRLDNPAERARVEDIIAHRTTYAEVTPVESRHNEVNRVVGITSAGLQVEPYPSATPVVVPEAQLRYFSTYDHLRGARDGALVAGVPTFVVGALFGLLLFESLQSGCTGGCGNSNSNEELKVVLVIGGVGGLIAAVIGAGFGALAGHEDRYVPGRATLTWPDQGVGVSD